MEDRSNSDGPCIGGGTSPDAIELHRGAARDRRPDQGRSGSGRITAPCKNKRRKNRRNRPNKTPNFHSVYGGLGDDKCPRKTASTRGRQSSSNSLTAPP